MRYSICALSAMAATSLAAYTPAYRPAARPAVRPAVTSEVENRTIEEIHQAALKEGGVVTVWHGGDEKNQQDQLKQAFEKAFPGMTLNITVDLSKYHDGNLDDQLASKSVHVDSIVLQTLQDYPRWKSEGALLNYKPLNFDKVAAPFKDADGAYYGYAIYLWSTSWNPKKIAGHFRDFSDALKPELKDKLILTYPNDDDAVLYAFELITQKLGVKWFDSLLAQNPRWVRGTATPADQIALANTSYVATFGTGAGPATLNSTQPTDAPWVSWPQTAAILKDAPHPEGAKLFHNFILSNDYQFYAPQFTVRTDAPAGFPNIFNQTNTNVTAFLPWMMDRANVERRRFWYESRIGTAQGVSPLDDDM